MTRTHRSKPVFFTLPLFFLGCSHFHPPPVILTTDAGVEVDDQWAIAYLLLAADDGKVDLRGIVTTHAPSLRPPAAESSAEAAREVLQVLQARTAPPIVAGSSVPIGAELPPDQSVGANFIVEQSRGFSAGHRLTILSIGAATDIAGAILIDPEIVNRVEVVAMGFERWPEGGDPWNVKNDPRAFQMILDSKVPLTIGAADVCQRHLTLDPDGARRQTRRGGKAGEYLQRKFDEWLARKEELCRKMTGRLAWPIWDVITVAHVLGMTTADVRSRPRLRDDLTFDLGSESSRGGTIRWITALDGEQVWADFARLASSRPGTRSMLP